jgi:uncharacterized protein YyaL (SSP411 family)
MLNRLASESSPYLLQHADNPVEWYPWSEEALQKAEAENKPIFLSIGYSACHWCHVMAHESFEDAETAAIMNEHFVNIKVDREERPDLDSIYMDAVVSITGRGGWPMSVFLTPDGLPFYAGTYFPPTDRYGTPAFKGVLLSVARAYRERRQEINQWNEQFRTHLDQGLEPSGSPAWLAPETLDEAYGRVTSDFDATHGGFGEAPKFPQPMILEFLLRHHHRTDQQHALDMVDLTLTRMAAGGIYDQLGGGFHRYSTDARWLVPHFEKMLYDNALLARVYLHAWQVTGRSIYRRIVEETLDYVIREMTDPDGGFYSAQDADSEGEEGKFFVWTPDEIREILGGEAEAFMAAYGVTRHGNFEGKNILEFVGHLDQRPALAEARPKLFEAREGRVHPGRDDKVLTSWNGLMLAAFAEAARVLDREDYRQVAERNANFVLCELRQENGRLLHSWKDGRARFNAYLEDYAFYAYGLLALYEATFDVRWFIEARSLADMILSHFSDDRGGFFDTSDDHERLITRPRQVQDNAMPSGNAVAVDVLLRLAALTGSDTYRHPAEAVLEQLTSVMRRHPLASGHWLSVLTFHLSSPYAIALAGEPAADDTQALLDVALGSYRPHQVVALSVPGGDAASHIPLLVNRVQQDGRATAHVCREFVCQLPVTDPRSLAAQLEPGTLSSEADSRDAH